jgi:hypothetical protein
VQVNFINRIAYADLMLLNHPRVVGDFSVGWNYGTLRNNGLGKFLHIIFDHDRRSSLVASRSQSYHEPSNQSLPPTASRRDNHF